MMKVELCVDSLDSIDAAKDFPISRIELCSCLSEGGLTPTHGMLKLAKKKANVPIFCMIRPRSGDFLYSTNEFTCMKEDVIQMKDLADGYVFGILTPDGEIDAPRVQELSELCHPKEVTFHRAFDMTRDLSEALEVVIKLGIKRVLTSGSKSTCIEGKQVILSLVKQASGRISIMPGSGVTKDNIFDISGWGVDEVHLTAKKIIPSKMEFRNFDCTMGSDKIEADSDLLRDIFAKL
jgi:copper homeostasis protein